MTDKQSTIQRIDDLLQSPHLSASSKAILRALRVQVEQHGPLLQLRRKVSCIAASIAEPTRPKDRPLEGDYIDPLNPCP
jgi:hypothetical protein